MRLWSIHPKYLDSKGLTALWREALLAKAVLEGKTKGYTRHPQLDRFRAQRNPVAAINNYLRAVYQESCRRGFCFDIKKLGPKSRFRHIPVTEGQKQHEWEHLKKKLKIRDKAKLQELKHLQEIDHHPLFIEVSGDKEHWEK